MWPVDEQETPPPAPPPAPGVLGVVALPGLAVWRRWPVVASLLFAGGVIAPCFAVAMLLQHRGQLVHLLTRPHVLRGLTVVAVVAMASRVAAVWFTAARLSAPAGRRQMQVRGTVAVALLALPTALGVVRLEQAREVVDEVLQDSPDAGRVAVADAATDPYAGEFETVLLMGSDEGQDRVGLRTDSMILAFVHRATGRTALVSVPRNLVHLRFPPGSPLARRFPDGYDDSEGGLTNAIYVNVEDDPQLAKAYTTKVAAAGVNALMQGMSYSFGITIDDYLLVNSCAFVKVVDAIGGVTIHLDKALPMPAKLRCSNYRLTPTIGPGDTYMDGTKALGYVRSRLADSDYQRMERQRTLLQTIAKEVGFGDLLRHFGELASAVKDNVRTSMTADEALNLLTILQGNETDLESIGLVPPLFEPGTPDYTQLKAIMQDIRHSLAVQAPLTIATTSTTPTTSTTSTSAGG